MVRDYKRKLGSRTYINYTIAQLEEALRRIADDEISMKQAAKDYKIPYGTLNNKFHGRHIHQPGGQSIFSEDEELAIVNSALKCADWGFPLNMHELRMLAGAYLEKCGRIVPKFKNNIPGKDWALSLLERRKDNATQRLASNISKARATVSRETLETFYNHLRDTLDGVEASNVFNYDETNVADDPGKARGIYRRGVKYPERVVNHSKSNTSIMVCGSADGTLLPPYVIYKSEHLYDTWKEGGIQGKPCCDKPCCSKGCRFNRTSHGWIDANTFQDWFETSFLPHARRLEGRKVLIGDNLSSHLNDSVIRQCEENDIAFVCLVPNSTHICQPLDVAFFKPMKVAWRAVLEAYKLRNKNKTISKEEFPALLKSALMKMDIVQAQSKNKPGDQEISAIKRNLINGFYGTGILPFNPQKVLDKIPGNSFDQAPVPVVEDALTKILKDNRFGDKVERVPRKKKRLNVVPGKSITTADSSEEEDEPSNHLSSSSCSSASEDDEPTLPVEEPEVEYLQAETGLLKVGRFVVVKFIGGRRQANSYKYVCKIKELLSDGEYTVFSYKAANNDKTVFKPVFRDVSTVPMSDITTVLPEPVDVDNNGLITFGGKVNVLEFRKGG